MRKRKCRLPGNGAFTATPQPAFYRLASPTQPLRSLRKKLDDILQKRHNAEKVRADKRKDYPPSAGVSNVLSEERKQVIALYFTHTRISQTPKGTFLLCLGTLGCSLDPGVTLIYHQSRANVGVWGLSTRGKENHD